MEEETVKIQIEVPKSQIMVTPSEGDQPPESEKKLPESKAETELAKLREEVAKRNDSVSGSTSGSGNTDKLKSIASSPAEALPLVKDKSPPNKIQKILIVVGVVIAVVGLILWPVISFTVGIAVAVFGALITALATLIKIGG